MMNSNGRQSQSAVRQTTRTSRCSPSSRGAGTDADAYITARRGPRAGNGRIPSAARRHGDASARPVDAAARPRAQQASMASKRERQRDGAHQQVGKKLMLLEGEGDRRRQSGQNVQDDVVIPPQRPVSMSVFCVEHGRLTSAHVGRGGRRPWRAARRGHRAVGAARSREFLTASARCAPEAARGGAGQEAAERGVEGGRRE